MWLSLFFNMMRLTFLNKNLITLNNKQTKSTTHFTMHSAHKKSHIIDHDNKTNIKSASINYTQNSINSLSI